MTVGVVSGLVINGIVNKANTHTSTVNSDIRPSKTQVNMRAKEIAIANLPRNSNHNGGKQNHALVEVVGHGARDKIADSMTKHVSHSTTTSLSSGNNDDKKLNVKKCVQLEKDLIKWKILK
jgi:hypothetical protein